MEKKRCDVGRLCAVFEFRIRCLRLGVFRVAFEQRSTFTKQGVRSILWRDVARCVVLVRILGRKIVAQG